MKEKEAMRIVGELIKECETLEKKKARILQGIEELPKKSRGPEEIKSRVRQLLKSINDFRDKIEAIEKTASKL